MQHPKNRFFVTRKLHDKSLVNFSKHGKFAGEYPIETIVEKISINIPFKSYLNTYLKRKLKRIFIANFYCPPFKKEGEVPFFDLHFFNLTLPQDKT